MASRIEPEYAPHYEAWKAAPSPARAAALLDAVRPDVERAARLHVGNTNPLLMSRARRMALDGLRRYDPSAGPLRPYLTQHLAGLKRVNRAQTTLLKVPERVALDRSKVESASREFEAERGRAPSDGELADFAGLHVDRVRRVRSYRPAVSEGAVEASTGGAPMAATNPFASKGLSAWERLVYDDLPAHDQRVVDMHLAGLENREIARRLGVSPGAVSQRKARIQALFDASDELSPF